MAILSNFLQQQARHPLAAFCKTARDQKRTDFLQQLPAGNLFTSFLQNFPVPFSHGLLEIKKKASTTLRGVFFVLKKMWQYTQRGCLAEKAPLVTDLLGAWDKEHRTKQSAVFTREHISKCTT
jgi:hypothetical protein